MMKSILPERVDQLKTLMNQGTGESVSHFFDDCSEKERKAFLPVVEHIIRDAMLPLGCDQVSYDEWLQKLIPFETAILSTASFSQFRKLCSKLLPQWQMFSTEALIPVLLSRKPEWTDSFMIDLMDYDHPLDDHEPWTVYYQCLKNHACSRLFDEAVIFRMIQEFRNEPEAMAEYPELFEKEFWLIFEIEFRHPFWLTSNDSASYCNSRFCDAFVRFATENRIDRQRLLDSTLTVLNYGYKEYELRWYANLFRMLEPTIDEIQQRENRWFELLSHHNACSIALGFDMLMELNRMGLLDPKQFLTQTIPLFQEKPKARSKKILQVAAKFVSQEDSLRRPLLNMAMAALSRPEADVQTEAAHLIRQYIQSDDFELRSSLSSLIPFLAASVQRLLSDLCPSDEKDSIAVSEESPATLNQGKSNQEISLPLNSTGSHCDRLNMGPLDVPRLDSIVSFQPCQNYDDVVNLAMEIVAQPSSYDQYELLLDGWARFYPERSEDIDSRVSPLKKRILKSQKFILDLFNIDLFDGYASRIPQGLLFLLKILAADRVVVNECSNPVEIVVYIERDKWTSCSNQYCIPEDIFSRRVFETMCRLNRGIVLPPLATPTHVGGWIDPVVLAERILCAQGRTELYDECEKISSLYRLPSDHRTEALERLASVVSDDPYLKTLRLVLSGSDEPDSSLPIHYRAAHEADIALRLHHPLFEFCIPALSRMEEAENNEKYSWDVTGMSKVLACVPLSGNTLLYPLAKMGRQFDEFHYEAPFLKAVFQWRSRLVPAVHDPFYWRAMQRLCNDQENGTDWSAPEAFLEPLLDPNEPMTLPAAMMTLQCLAFKPESLATMAQDILIQTLANGRLDARRLADAALYWLAKDLPKIVRWQKRFQTIANQSKLHADQIRQLLEIIIPKIRTKELSGFIPVLYECCVSLQKTVEQADCQLYLQHYSGTGKTAQLVKELIGNKDSLK